MAKKVKLKLKINKDELRNKLEIKDPIPDTGEQIIKKIDPLKNVLNFQVLRNIPDFVLFKDLPKSGGDSGGGGILPPVWRDSTGTQIGAYVTDIQFGTGITQTYSGGKITISAPDVGTVTSVSGTTNRITSTGGTTPVIDISANYVGQSSITTVGTLTQNVYAYSFATILPGVITRVGNYISQVALTGGKTITITRSGNYISSITDGTKTWSYTRNGSNQITSWSVV